MEKENIAQNSDALTAPLNEEFSRIVHSRRSIRIFDETPIPEKTVRDCLHLATLAPNSSNLQPWEFYWVRSPEKKRRLVEICMNQNAAKTAAEIIVIVGRIDKVNKTRKEILAQAAASGKPVPEILRKYYTQLVPFIYTVGPCSMFAPFKWILFTLIGFFKVVPREPLTKSDLRLWAAKSSALACENLMLAFSSYGFDTCPMEGLDSKRMKRLLGLPRSSTIVMAIGVGKRKPEGVYGDRMRLPAEECIKEV